METINKSTRDATVAYLENFLMDIKTYNRAFFWAKPAPKLCRCWRKIVESGWNYAAAMEDNTQQARVVPGIYLD